MTLNDFLFFLINAGGNVVIASWILERIDWYQARSANAKQWIFFGSAAGIAVAAYCVLTFVSAAVLATFAPIFLILYATFAAVFLGSAFHVADKNINGKG